MKRALLVLFACCICGLASAFELNVRSAVRAGAGIDYYFDMTTSEGYAQWLFPCAYAGYVAIAPLDFWKGFGVRAEAGLACHGSSVKSSLFSRTDALTYLKVALIPQYSFVNGKLHVYSGIQGGTCLGGSSLSSYYGKFERGTIDSSDYSRFTVDAVAGVSYDIFGNFELELRLLQGLTGIFEASGVSQLLDSVQLGLVYKF